MGGSNGYASLHPGQEEPEPEELHLQEPQQEKPQGRFRWLAEAISLVFHPIVMPSLLFALIFLLSPRVTAPLAADLRWSMLSLLVLTTLIIPLVSMLVLYYFGSIPNLKMPDRQERRMPFLFISIFYAVTTYFFITKYQHFIHINIMLTGITFVIFMVSIISLYWKISAHSAAVGGVVGFMASFSLVYHDALLLYGLVGMVVVAGAVMSARLYLHEHQPAEVWTGSMLGLLVSIATVFFFLFF
ncbi:hypothetical protein [Nafulsella turpanensis]|uniref:hypothetical protein n=1 Tax=Nafulsella turpanensis TaxID=1265690 RepID=UPI00034B68D7|nr:hypothetical protein [Nafulsella turpanensis]